MQTWGQNTDHLFYSDHFDKNKSIYQVSQRDDYHSNEDKHINCLNLLPSMIGSQLRIYDWLFFCDDDTFVNVANLYKYAEQAVTDTVHAQTIRKKRFSRNMIYFKKSLRQDFVYPSGGAGILVPRQIYERLYPFSSFNTGFSDVSLGLNLNKSNIKITDPSLFHSQPPEHYKHKIEEIKNAISYHYIKTNDEMKALFSTSR